LSEQHHFRPALSGAYVVDSTTFRFLLDLEVHKAERLHYCVSVMCLAVDLPQAQLEGSVSLASLLVHYLRATDAVAPYARSSLGVLLVGAEKGHLAGIYGRLSEHLDPLPWGAGASTYPETATRPDDMLRQAVNLAFSAREAGGTRLFLPT
jgi:hypothetical protein